MLGQVIPCTHSAQFVFSSCWDNFKLFSSWEDSSGCMCVHSSVCCMPETGIRPGLSVHLSICLFLLPATMEANEAAWWARLLATGDCWWKWSWTCWQVGWMIREPYSGIIMSLGLPWTDKMICKLATGEGRKSANGKTMGIEVIYK